MALKKTTSTAKTAAKKTAEVKAEPAKAAEKAVKAEPAKAEAKAEKAEPAKAIETKKDTTKKLETKAAVLVDTPAEKAEEKKTTTAKKTAAKKETVKKETIKKTAARKTAAKAAAAEAVPAVPAADEKAAEEKPVKTPAKRGPKKSTEVKGNVTVQFAGKSYSTDELVKIAKDVWKYDLGKDEADFRSVELYVKPEESSVYYVINGDITGSFNI